MNEALTPYVENLKQQKKKSLFFQVVLGTSQLTKLVAKCMYTYITIALH